jgi:hypothetical protein
MTNGSYIESKSFYCHLADVTRFPSCCYRKQTMGTVGHNKKKKIKARYANLKLGRFTLLSYHEINAILFHHESIDLSYGLVRDII